FSARQMTNRGCEPLDRGRNNAKSGEVHGMAVTRNDLRRNRLYREPHGFRYMSFDARVDLRKCPHRPGDGASCDLFTCSDKALKSARKFRVGVSQFEAKCGRFGMNAMRASNGGRQLVFKGAPFECSKQFVDISNEDVCGPYELHVEAGIQHIGRGHTRVHKPRFRSDDFGQMGQKSDDVMLDLRLDFINAADVELRGIAFFPDFLCSLFRDSAELRHGVRSVSFDLKPDSEFGFRRPDRGHLRTGITRDGHAASPRARAAALRIAAMLPL